MQTIHAVVLGLVEGVTEFLPISSTFHLIWTSRFLGIPNDDFLKSFEVIIQTGAILAILQLFIHELLENKVVLKSLFYSFLPTAIVGYILHKIIKTIFFEQTLLMLLAFIGVGFIFIFSQKIFSTKNESKKILNMNILDAVKIGLFQSLAVFPGVSRAGAVMLGMKSLGYDYAVGAKYSFFLALPSIMAAGILDAWEYRSTIFVLTNLKLVLIGTIVSYISALFVVKWFVAYLGKNGLYQFGLYRVIIGLILLTSLYLGK